MYKKREKYRESIDIAHDLFLQYTCVRVDLGEKANSEYLTESGPKF